MAIDWRGSFVSETDHPQKNHREQMRKLVGFAVDLFVRVHRKYGQFVFR